MAALPPSVTAQIGKPLLFKWAVITSPALLGFLNCVAPMGLLQFSEC